MEEAEFKGFIKTQTVVLKNLLSCLEDHGELHAKEYLYCQAKLHEVVKDLKRLERVTL